MCVLDAPPAAVHSGWDGTRSQSPARRVTRLGRQARPATSGVRLRGGNPEPSAGRTVCWCVPCGERCLSSARLRCQSCCGARVHAEVDPRRCNDVTPVGAAPGQSGCSGVHASTRATAGAELRPMTCMCSRERLAPRVSEALGIVRICVDVASVRLHASAYVRAEGHVVRCCVCVCMCMRASALGPHVVRGNQTHAPGIPLGVVTQR